MGDNLQMAGGDVEPAVAIGRLPVKNPAVIRQDYLLRLIEQAAQMLARLFRLQSEGKTAETIELSRDASEQWLGLDEKRLIEMDDGELIEHVQARGSVGEFPVRLGIAIALLKTEAARAASAGEQPAARQISATAIGLLLRADILGLSQELPGFTPRLADLLAEVPLEELPERIVVLMMCRHEHLGQFGMAEDVLFLLKERCPDADWLQELGQEFYERLLKRTNAELEFGNLPRAEVEEGLREWGGR